jgi:hypothetical protein
VAWDSTRPVPWQRLIREWLLYVGVMTALLLVFLRNTSLIGVFAGLLVSGPLYLAFGYALAKLGYQRRTMKQLRAEAPVRGSKRSAGDDEPADVNKPRPKPAPTSRTGGGAQRSNAKRRR